MLKALVTGSEGFIGKKLVAHLLDIGIPTIGVDKRPHPENVWIDLADHSILPLLKSKRIDTIFHLAAETGVHPSTTVPEPYIRNNINAFFNVIKAAEDSGTVKNFIYASSSSIEMTSPLNFYGITKQCNEMIGQYFNEKIDMNIWGIRYFSVYGPGGRGDMAIPTFIRKVFNEKEIILYGNPERYYTYVDDIVNATIQVIKKECGIYNAYREDLINLEFDVIKRLQMIFNKKPQVTYEAPRPYELDGSIVGPFSNIINFNSSVNFETGLKLTVDDFMKTNNK